MQHSLAPPSTSTNLPQDIQDSNTQHEVRDSSSWTKFDKRSHKQRSNKEKDIRAAAQKLRVLVRNVANTNIKSSVPFKHLFVDRVDRDVDASVFKPHLKVKNIVPREISYTFKES